MGPDGEYVPQEPQNCLTRHFSVGMQKKDRHIDQWESCASVLSTSYEENPSNDKFSYIKVMLS